VGPGVAVRFSPRQITTRKNNVKGTTAVDILTLGPVDIVVLDVFLFWVLVNIDASEPGARDCATQACRNMQKNLWVKTYVFKAQPPEN